MNHDINFVPIFVDGTEHKVMFFDYHSETSDEAPVFGTATTASIPGTSQAFAFSGNPSIDARSATVANSHMSGAGLWPDDAVSDIACVDVLSQAGHDDEDGEDEEDSGDEDYVDEDSQLYRYYVRAARLGLDLRLPEGLHVSEASSPASTTTPQMSTEASFDGASASLESHESLAAASPQRRREAEMIWAERQRLLMGCMPVPVHRRSISDPF